MTPPFSDTCLRQRTGRPLCATDLLTRQAQLAQTLINELLRLARGESSRDIFHRDLAILIHGETESHPAAGPQIGGLANYAVVTGNTPIPGLHLKLSRRIQMVFERVY